MAKKRKRKQKSIGEYEVEEGKQHKAKVPRPHLAGELYEKGQEVASLVRNLTPAAQRRALGLRKNQALPDALLRQGKSFGTTLSS